MKLFVHCFQDLKIKNQTKPYLAEFVEQLGQAPSTARAVIKIGNNKYTVSRAACSETPFTQEELDKVALDAAPKTKPQTKRAGSGKSAEPKPKVEGKFW